MFPALLIARSLVPVRVKTETSFTADDPWNGNHRTSYTVEAYLKLFKGSKPPKTKPLGAIYLYGIRSNIDGVERMLPDSLSELWRTQRVRTEALPRMLNQMEPALKKGDYRPVLGNKALSVIIRIVIILFGLLALLPFVISITAPAEFPLLWAVWAALAIAGFAWLYTYLLFFRAKGRRARQMEWILAHQ
jgi:hypothetical protein